jgi:dTMP kinase
VIIAIEGIDGVGKGTQSKILHDNLINFGLSASLVSFPVYDSFFGKMIAEYLNGRYGSLNDIHPKLVANLYAFDRWDYFNKHNINENEFMVIDRYVPSNLAHQASKLADRNHVYQMFEWIDELEHDVLGQPKPNLVLVLDAPVELASIQVLKKKSRSYTELNKDLHEADEHYLGNVRSAYLELCNNNDSYRLINCNESNNMKSIEGISREIWTIVVEYFSLSFNKYQAE